MSERPKLKASPLPCPSGYSLHLYCKYDNPEHSHHEFPWEISEEETRPRSIAAARSLGWLFHRDNTATCPKCVRALRSGRRALTATPDRAQDETTEVGTL